MKALILIFTLLLSSTSAFAVVKGFRPSHRRFQILDRLVNLKNPGNGICNGTLVTPNIVITAAHCLNPYVAIFEERNSHDQAKFFSSMMTVTPVMKDRYTLNSVNVKDFAFVKKQLDADGNILSGLNTDRGLLGDLALLYLSSPLQPINGFKVGLSLGFDSDIENINPSFAFGTGFFENKTNSNPSRELRGYKFDWEPFNKGETTDDNLIFKLISGPAMCVGDSGGPLFHRDSKGEWHLVGVLSRLISKGWLYHRIFGFDVCLKAKTNAYSSIKFYAPWILKTSSELIERNASVAYRSFEQRN